MPSIILPTPAAQLSSSSSSASLTSSFRKSSRRESSTHHTHGYLTAASKSTTRHLAALDFLLNIPMMNETKIKETGMEHAARARKLDGDFGNDDDDEDEESVDPSAIGNGPMHDAAAMLADDYYGSATAVVDIVGRKLQGTAAPTLRVPPHFRYNMLRINEQSAVIRHWEVQLLARGPVIPTVASTTTPVVQPPVLQQPLLSSRLFYSRVRAYPTLVFSVIKYDAGEEKAKLAKLRAEDRKGLEVFALTIRDWRGFSYKALFRQLAEERAEDYYFERGYMYDPNALDDPEMHRGAHRYVQHPVAATGPIVSSVILFVNEKNLKQSLNEQFRERHPQLPPSLTLSKIRNLKKSALLGCMARNIELSTVALAVILFERLCLKGLVTKANRRLTMAVSLLLAYKFNECVTSQFHTRLETLLDFVDREWSVARKQVFEAEFGAFVHLGFNLHVPHQHVFLVCSRLLKLVYMNFQKYLGDDLMDLYSQDIMVYERERAYERTYQEEVRLQEENDADAEAKLAQDEQQEHQESEGIYMRSGASSPLRSSPAHTADESQVEERDAKRAMEIELDEERQMDRKRTTYQRGMEREEGEAEQKQQQEKKKEKRKE